MPTESGPVTGPPPRRRPVVSLTPLIDVVFILLVFFMLATSFADWRGMQAGATPAGTSGAASPTGSQLVEMRGDGTLRLGGIAVAEPDLVQRLSDWRAQRRDGAVLVAMQPDVTFGDLAGLLDRLAGAGIDGVSLLEPAR